APGISKSVSVTVKAASQRLEALYASIERRISAVLSYLGEARPRPRQGYSGCLLGPGSRKDEKMTGRLCLLVVGEQQFATHWLPERGEVTIGQAKSCDIRINEPSIAPKHALLRIDGELTIEDLGSSSGTRVSDQLAEPGQRLTVGPGATISLGAVSVVVQKN